MADVSPGQRVLTAGAISGQRGNVVIIVALFLTVLLGFMAMAVDVGLFMWEKRELQNIADAAALAGVQELPDDPDAAVEIATDYATRNGVGSRGWVLQSVMVLPAGCSAEEEDCTVLEVRVRHPDAPFFLGRVLGLTTATVASRAQAAIQSPQLSDNVMPWSLRDSVRRRARYGDLVTVKYSAGGGSQGDYGALSIQNPRCAGNNGANLYRCNIREGATVQIGIRYPTEPGNMRGPTRQGLQDRLDATDADCDTFEEVFQRVGDSWRFRSDDCNPWSEAGQGSKRVVLIPVISDDDDPGRSEVTVLGFAVAFIESFDCPTGNQCDVRVRFVQAVMSAEERMRFGPYNPMSDIRIPRLVG